MNDLNVQFILKYQDDVVRFCYYLCRNENLAQDLAQETFLKVFTKKYENIQNPKAFLFQIAKNLLFDLKRRQVLEQNQTSMKSQLKTIEMPDLEVWQVLFSLDQDDQDVLMLVDREGLSLIEAAEHLNLSEAALKSRLFRARENYKIKWNS